MKLQIKYFVSAFLALALLAGWANPAYAVPCTVTSVLPSFVLNDTATPVVIAGTNFSAGSVVSLEGLSGTTFIAGVNNTFTELEIVVPAGIPAGTYKVVVTAPDPTSSCNLPNGLAVADPSPLPTATLLPTATSLPTSTPQPFNRPQMVISSYEINDSKVRSGDDFKLSIDFKNAGTSSALNVQALFSSPDLIAIKTGGVVVLDTIILAGNHSDAVQSFYALDSASGKAVVTIDATLTYYDEKGTAYSDKFTLSVPASGGTGVAYPTATPTGVNTAQLVITSYASTVDPLQPGEQFQLGLTVQNMGNTGAKHVTMIVGGGSSGESGGTPQPGGVSGSSGEFTNFAPVNASNIQSLGDIPAGGGLQVLQNLIVNVSTNPGAYPMKITFSYVNNKGEVVNDDQVITLLVYSLPNVDVGYYRPLDSFFAGEPGSLPIQIVNLGKRSTVLGNMKIETTGGTLDPASTLVGPLDPGGYFTFDSTLFPDAAGPMDLTITIDYTDDFNQSRTLTRTLSLTVEESFIEETPDPSQEGTKFPTATDESFFHKVWRAILGLLGLDSAPPGGEVPSGEPSPGEEMIPIPSGDGGKG